MDRSRRPLQILEVLLNLLRTRTVVGHNIMGRIADSATDAIGEAAWDIVVRRTEEREAQAASSHITLTWTTVLIGINLRRLGRSSQQFSPEALQFQPLNYRWSSWCF
jgi:PhoPQ-activated pathogenicity-related protein